MTAGYARCRVCGTSYPMTIDIPLDQDGVCEGCRAEPEPEPCSMCEGAGGFIMPACCGNVSPTGECCGDPIPEQAPCPHCGGSGDEP